MWRVRWQRFSLRRQTAENLVYEKLLLLITAASLNKCRFPLWLANYNHWHTLDYSVTYSFHHRNSTLRITNSSGLEMKVVCAQTKHVTRDESSVMLLTHYTMGWYVDCCQTIWLKMNFPTIIILIKLFQSKWIHLYVLLSTRRARYGGASRCTNEETWGCVQSRIF